MYKLDKNELDLEIGYARQEINELEKRLVVETNKSPNYWVALHRAHARLTKLLAERNERFPSNKEVVIYEDDIPF